MGPWAGCFPCVTDKEGGSQKPLDLPQAHGERGSGQNKGPSTFPEEARVMLSLGDTETLVGNSPPRARWRGDR